MKSDNRKIVQKIELKSHLVYMQNSKMFTKTKKEKIRR